jgi:peptide/nickel transport system substrate-binding protein
MKRPAPAFPLRSPGGRALRAGFAISLCLALSAASPAPAAEAPLPAVKNPDTFVYLHAGEINSLDPAWNGDDVSASVFLNLYDTLFAFDGASTENLLPIVAAKTPSRENGLISADGKTYTIPIRKGIRFHDGTPLTPEDVRYSMMRFMIMDAGPAMMLLDPLEGYHQTRDASNRLFPDVFQRADRAVRVEGDGVVLRLPRPFPPLLPILARWCPILSKRWAVAHGDWDGTEATWTKFNMPQKEASPFFAREMGSGPFSLERWDRGTREIVLARDEAYWRGPAKLKRVIFRAISEFATRKLMLEAGDADAIDAGRPEIARLESLTGVEIIDDLPLLMVSPAIEFCYRIEPKGNPYIGSGKLDGDGIPPDFFADRDVRKGFAYSFDYAGFIRDTLRGKGTQATGFIPKGMPAYNPLQKTYSLDLEKAAEHFRKARGGQVWKRGFRLSILYSAGGTSREIIGQILKRNVEKLNPRFKIDLRAVEWPTLLDAQDHSKISLMVMGRYAPYPDPHALAFQFMLSDPTSQCQYKNDASDRLVNAALSETDPEKRVDLYRRLLELEYDDVPFIPIADSVDARVQRTWVRGWSYNAMLPNSGLFYSIDKATPRIGDPRPRP